MRRLISALIAIGLVVSAHCGAVAAGTSSTPTPPNLSSIPDLTGDWVFADDGKTIGTIHIGFTYLSTAGPTITSAFTPPAACPYGNTRTSLFDTYTFLDANRMQGQMEECTGGDGILVTQCGFPSLFSGDYRTKSIMKDKIIGERKREVYDGSPPCNWTRKPAKDTWVDFTLTRVPAPPSPPPPSTPAATPATHVPPFGDCQILDRIVANTTYEQCKVLSPIETSVKWSPY